MKRFLALLALVLVLMAGTAGMASALTLDFEVPGPGTYAGYGYFPPSGSPILNVDVVNWHNEGGGHLYLPIHSVDSVIRFTNPTYVNKFEMTGLSYEGGDWIGCGPMNIAAFNAGGGSLWTTTVNLEDYSEWDNWLTVPVNRDNISKITFYARASVFWPSIDNLVINEAPPVPIPASVLLLGSGLLALVGLRRKFTR